MFRMRALLVLLLGVGLTLAAADPLEASYQNEVLADGPHGYWRLGESAGLVAVDAGPNGLDGNYGQFAPPDGLPTLGVRGITANYTDTAVRFNGTSPVSQVFVSDSANPVDYSLEAWVKVDAGATTSRGLITRTAGSPLTTWSHQLRINSNGQFEHYTFDGGARRVWDSAAVRPDEWHHVVGLFHPGTPGFMSIYVNGALAMNWTGSLNNPWTGGNHWRFAAPSGDGMNWFDGDLDEVAIYHHLLTPDRILAHYKAGVMPEPATLLIWSLLAGLGVGLGWRRRR